MTYKTKGFLLYLFGFVFICFLRDKVNHMTIILLCIGYLLFICLFYTVNKSAAIEPFYNFLQRVLKENNKKRITNEDIVNSMKRYEMIIKTNAGNEYKYFKANNINSLVGMAEDMMEDDWSIKHIMIRDMNSTEMEIVK